MSLVCAGSGKDVLLLHGYGASKESFYYQINFLKDYFKVTAADFPSFGASEGFDTPWSVGDYADWLKDFMRARGMERPLVVAHSFGARVAFKLFGGGGAEAEKIVITGGAGHVKERSPRYMRRLCAYRRWKKVFPRFAEKHFGSEEYRKLSPLMKESYKKIVNEDLKDYAGKITAPVLLIYGNGDTVTPRGEEGETFAALIKNSRLESMEGGHFCFCEHPEVFNEKILAFLL